jgi:hypothetical protein
MFWFWNDLSLINNKKHTLTTPKMMKDNKQQKDMNVDKEWQNGNN